MGRLRYRRASKDNSYIPYIRQRGCSSIYRAGAVVILFDLNPVFLYRGDRRVDNSTTSSLSQVLRTASCTVGRTIFRRAEGRSADRARQPGLDR